MRLNPKVIDISHYDTVTDFKKTRAAGYLGVIHKATDGLTGVDHTYRQRRVPAADAGLLWGAYHFFRPGNPRFQVENFLDNAKPDDDTVIVLDHELSSVPLDAAREFMEVCNEEMGRFPWLYSGNVIKEQLGRRIDPFWKGIKLWIAHYNAHPTWPPTWDAPTLWQFTGDGVGPEPHEVPGVTIPGGCDINSFDGSDEDLIALWKNQGLKYVF